MNVIRLLFIFILFYKIDTVEIDTTVDLSDAFFQHTVLHIVQL